jgi:hypothetical protein
VNAYQILDEPHRDQTDLKVLMLTPVTVARRTGDLRWKRPEMRPHTAMASYLAIRSPLASATHVSIRGQDQTLEIW